ncbi:putative membrane protein YdbT with pleckstrin-like domain [Nocardiopsis mwathae]|uniref:Putative membrane protein YdbT with pleckstrin-like domain n=1 Tax=Nocardiopsis mwathae TaxID=1472723 RepID=A0A7W9YD93_9ACTN|nr:PH domain-containing protein [Nocardiopsis mwathae]MBB6170050.1 putative membrane protein YdbT with pleckstrin-like domain [Nocardiopsis mwathae]
MAIADRYLAEGEELVYVTRQHWTTVLAEFIALIVVIAVAAGLVWFMPAGEEWTQWATYAVILVAVIAAVVFWLIPTLKWWTTAYILTNRRLMYRYGMLSKHGRDMPLTRVNDVTFSISLWERIMRYGNLSVQSASEQEGMELRKVPRVEWLQSEIYRQVEEANRRSTPPPEPPDHHGR